MGRAAVLGAQHGSWWIGWIATSLGWLLVLSVIALSSSSLTRDVNNAGLLAQLHVIALLGLYQLTIGGVLATILQPDSQRQVSHTTRGQR